MQITLALRIQIRSSALLSQVYIVLEPYFLVITQGCTLWFAQLGTLIEGTTGVIQLSLLVNFPWNN